jgi:hypothetical protein
MSTATQNHQAATDWQQEIRSLDDKAPGSGAIGSGRIRHTMDEVEIEHISRYGDVVVVMGHDTVEGPRTNVLTHRRFTNVWQLQDGTWQMIARHAQVIAPR